MGAWGLGEANPGRVGQGAAGRGLAFGAPLHVRSNAFGDRETRRVETVDDARAVLSGAGPLRFGADGRERAEWALALECAASAKFDRTPDAVEAARAALRAYARSVGILVGVGRPVATG